MMRLLVIAILFAFFISISHAASPVTTRDSVELDTQSALNELPPPPAPTTHPTVASPIARADNDRGGVRYWLYLITLFGAMLSTAAALGIAGSTIGTMVLLRREALAALAIPQVVAVGAAVALRMNWPTLPPAMAAALVGLFYLVLSKRRGGSTWILPSLYVSGICLSYLIIANKGQDITDLQNIFTGVDVAVSNRQAKIATPILLVTGLLCAVLWRRWLLMAQAPAAAELARLRPTRWDAMFLFLLTVVVLLGTDALGVVLVLVMLFLPAATALPWCRRIPAALAASSVLSLMFLGIGFYLSNMMGWPLSHSIGGVGFTALALSHLGVHLRRE